MIQTQYACLSGKTIHFSSSDSILGNVSHLSQPLLISIASGRVEATLQQMMVKNALGHMEPISSEVQMTPSGQIEMVYPSERITMVVETGGLLEIRPGCAYALNPLSDGTLIEYLLPLPYETPIFGTTTGLIDNQPIEDSIPFELVGKKTIATQVVQPEPIVEAIQPEILSEPLVETAVDKSTQEPLQPLKTVEIPTYQRYYYRDPSTAMLRIGLYCISPFALLSITASMFNPFFALLWLLVLGFCGYKAYLEAIQHFNNLPVLSIETDGLVISNRTYIDLKLNWDQILQIRLDAKMTRADTAELVLIVDVGDMSACVPALNILQRKLHKQLQINDPSVTPPQVRLSQSDVGTDLNELKTLIDQFV